MHAMLHGAFVTSITCGQKAQIDAMVTDILSDRQKDQKNEQLKVPSNMFSYALIASLMTAGNEVTLACALESSSCRKVL